MNTYLEPEDDSLPMRKSGPWVVEKLHYLRQYIDVFTTSMHAKPWRAMHYIDLFAGPGKCFVRENRTVHLGSPLLSLQTRYPFRRLFFAELESANINALKRRCRSSPRFSRIQFFEGDSNVRVHEIVQRISDLDGEYIEGRWSSINVAFLDPEGLELCWETVATLATVSRMDLIIHYPEMGLNRMMSKVLALDRDTLVDAFFGDREWRSIYRAQQGRRGIHRKLLDHYKGKLSDLGYAEVIGGDEVGYEPVVRNVKRRAPLYRVVFASKDPLGHEFWDKVTSRDAHGQLRLLEGRRTYGSSGQDRIEAQRDE